VTGRPGAEAQALDPRVLPLAYDAVLERGADGRHRVCYRLPIPYFAFLWAPLVRRRARRIEEAADAGRPLPVDVPWWAPPVPQDARATATVACLCLIGAVSSYGGGTGGLLTQTLPYAAKVYDVGNGALGTGLAIVRIGVLVALLLGPLADRLGRRRLVVGAIVAHCVVTAVIGLAPTFAAYIGGHVVLRCIDTLLSVAAGILAVESVPAGNRAVTLSLVFLASGAGVALAVASLPVAAAGRAGFAAVYLVQLLALPLVLHAGRRLRESRRYVVHAAERHGYRELLRHPLARRLALVGGVAFLSAIFFAPTAEFFTRYLDDVRHFSSLEIVLFLAVTGGPASLTVVLGGRLADVRGRKVVAVPAIVVAAFSFAGFFLTGPPWLWLFAFSGQVLGSLSLAALGVYTPELFPTRVRAAANTLVLACAVTGSGAGLATAGALAGPLGVGPAIAVLAIFPLLAAALIALRFPETRGRSLEETSGDTVPVSAELL
jgi:AAHS family benzoate transporter-like MFS transporter